MRLPEFFRYPHFHFHGNTILKMQLLGRLLARWTALATLVALAACSHSNNSSATTGSVRLINASPTSTVTLTLNGTAAFTSVAPHTTSNYLTETAGTYTVTATNSTGSLSSATISMTVASGYYSVIVFERNGSLVLGAITENQALPVAGQNALSVYNTSADAGPLDIYAVPAGTGAANLGTHSPIFSRLNSVSPAPNLLVAGTSYDFYATAAGNPADIRFSQLGVTPVSAQVQFLILTGTPGGSLVDGISVTQQGTVVFTPNTSARVRVVSALPATAGAYVVLTAGGVQLPATTSIFPRAYTLIPGASTAYSADISGTVLAGSFAPTFANGGDYTVVIYGTSVASAQISILTDSNLISVGQASLRLVNVGLTGTIGSTSVPQSVSLVSNGNAVTGNVLYGQASTYTGVTSGSSGLAVWSATTGVPINSPNSSVPNFVPSSVWTIFVTDSSLSNTAVLDR